jgi:uncharacterized protein (TIGR04255 family)
MGSKMANAPVYYSVAQVRFNPILSLDTYVTGLQEKLRKAGFPDFKKIQTVVFNFNMVGAPSGESEQVPQGQPLQRYMFLDMSGTSGFILDLDALSYQTTEYETFEKFSGELLDTLLKVHEAVNINYTERVGVRQLDAVIPNAGESLGQYLDAQVIGLKGKIEGELIHSFSETLVQTKVGQLLSRAIIFKGKLGFPPDVQSVGVRVADRFSGFQGEHAILDTDGFYAGRETFDIAGVKKRLFDLHTETSKAFKAATTEYAKQVWR